MRILSSIRRIFKAGGRYRQGVRDSGQWNPHFTVMMGGVMIGYHVVEAADPYVSLALLGDSRRNQVRNVCCMLSEK